MDEILVSVYCLAYNHEKYIRQCLDGFVMQKTDFAFEVIVHDDASTDGTAAIIREYAEKYPEIIFPILQTENQCSRHIGITKAYILPKMRGTYVAICEGDDYWTDPCKLQKQVDAMRTHPACHMCLCCVDLVDVNGARIGQQRPPFPVPAGEIASADFMQYLDACNFQTSSYLLRADSFSAFLKEPPAFAVNKGVGDITKLLYFAAVGNVYYIPDVMSCYRTGVPGSWSSRYAADPEKKREHAKKMYDMLVEFDAYTDHRYQECFSRSLRESAFNVLLTSGDLKTAFSAEWQDCNRKIGTKKRMLLYLQTYTPGLYKFFWRVYGKVKDRG